MAEREALRQQQAKQVNEPLEKPKQVPPLQYVDPGEQMASTANPQPLPNTLCPNCGHIVRTNATYCPNCRYPLSPAARAASPPLNISPKPELSTSDKVVAPSTIASQPQQAPFNETALDDLAIRATLQRLWDKAGR